MKFTTIHDAEIAVGMVRTAELIEDGSLMPASEAELAEFIARLRVSAAAKFREADQLQAFQASRQGAR
jgi:hypothetical protein